MALQVWLPLTRDLRNQGLGSVQTTNNTNFILKSGGKLGILCLDLSNTVRLYSPNLVNLKTFSFAFWYRPETSESTINWNDVIGFNDSKGGLFRLETSYSNSYMLSMHNNTQYGIIQNVASSYGSTLLLSSTSYSRDIWYHIAVTVEEDDNVKAYVNGELKCIVARSDGSITGYFNLGELGGSNKEDGSLNDLRIYDHCLSPMEVKQLSQGLVLHYPLNRQGFGQDNLMPNSVEMPVGSANPSTGTWRLAGSSQMTRSRVAIPNAPSGVSTYGFQSVGLQTGQDASCWGMDSFPRESGVTYTLSAWGRIVGGSTTAAMLGFSVYNSTTLDYGGTYGQAKSSDVEYYGSGAYDYAGGKLNPNGSWTRIYRTFTSTATSGNIYIGFNTAKTGNNVTLQMCGVKLEKGDKMTPWIPNSNESMYTTLGLNGTIEYDTSGYCNNGEKIGTLTYTSDTPKYQVSTHIGATSQKIHISGLTTSGFGNSYSFAWWGKRTSNSPMFWGFSDGIRLNGMYIGTLWNTGDGSNNPLYKIGTTTQVTAPSVNEWHHYVMTGNGTKCYVYLDGELWAEAKTYKAISGTSIYINGWNSATDYCSNNTDISDFRIYATALSAADVKSLYQNCVTIDPDGTIRGKIR